MDGAQNGWHGRTFVQRIDAIGMYPLPGGYASRLWLMGDFTLTKLYIGPVSARDRMNPSSKARKMVPAARPMKRFRELSYALRFSAIRAFVLPVAVSASDRAATSRSTDSVSARACNGNA